MADSPWRTPDLSPEAQQRRETLARFGLAMFHAQCVERQLAILLATTANTAFAAATAAERDRFFHAAFAKTLGRLVTTLRGKVTIAADFESRLDRAVQLRNWLAHEYFWERSEAILSSDGRELMIRELQDAADFLNAVDGVLTGVSQRWAEKMGISKEALEDALRKRLCGEDA